MGVSVSFFAAASDKDKNLMEIPFGGGSPILSDDVISCLPCLFSPKKMRPLSFRHSIFITLFASCSSENGIVNAHRAYDYMAVVQL